MSMLPLAEKEPAGDDRAKGGDADTPEHAVRQRFGEDRHAGDDRQGIAEEGGDACGSEWASVLESGLQDERPGGVAGDESSDEGQFAACLDGTFGGDVAGGKQQPGCESVGRSTAEAGRDRDRQDERGGNRGSDPGADRQRRGSAPLTVSAGQRYTQ